MGEVPMVNEGSPARGCQALFTVTGRFAKRRTVTGKLVRRLSAVTGLNF